MTQSAFEKSQTDLEPFRAILSHFGGDFRRFSPPGVENFLFHPPLPGVVHSFLPPLSSHPREGEGG